MDILVGQFIRCVKPPMEDFYVGLAGIDSVRYPAIDFSQWARTIQPVRMFGWNGAGVFFILVDKSVVVTFYRIWQFKGEEKAVTGQVTSGVEPSIREICCQGRC